jgi:hypothetical protein
MGMPRHILRTQLAMAKIYLGIGVAEEPKGSNHGFWVEEMQEDGGGNKGDAWCMHGVYSCHAEACEIQRIDPILSRTGWCKGQWLWAMDSPKVDIVHATEILNGWQIPDGAIWIRYDRAGCGHTGFVYDHDPGKKELKSLEFNCGDKADWRVYTITNIPDFKGVIL